jgi:hypothetical protein
MNNINSTIDVTAMAVENYKNTTWEALENDLLKLAYSFGNDYYDIAYDRVNKSFDHASYKGESALKHDYDFYNKMKEMIVAVVLEDLGLYPFVASNAPMTDADKKINPSYKPVGDFHDAFSIVDDRYIGIEFKCRTHLDDLQYFKDKDGKPTKGIHIVGKMYKHTSFKTNNSITINNLHYRFDGTPYKLGGVFACSKQRYVHNTMLHTDDRENLVARNYADYLKHEDPDSLNDVDGILTQTYYSYDPSTKTNIEYRKEESFKLLDCLHPAFHLVYNVGNHIYIYNMNYLISDYKKGYLKWGIQFKPVSTQMNKNHLPHDVFEIPLELVDQYVVQDGRLIEYIPRNPELICEEFIELPIMVGDIPENPDDRLIWNYNTYPIASDDEIREAQRMHGGLLTQDIQLSFDDILTLNKD